MLDNEHFFFLKWILIEERKTATKAQMGAEKNGTFYSLNGFVFQKTK